jgi:hypothetical protein
MHLTGLDLLFWAAGFAGHIVLLSVLCIRRRVKSFPFFTAFIATNILRTIALYVIWHFGTKSTYFYSYWYLAILDFALQLCVVYELASRTFRPRGVWAKDVRRSFIVLGSLSIVIAAALAWLANPPTRLWVQVVVIRGSLFSAALMSELFAGMMALSVTVGLPWKTHVASIAQGFGIYSIIEVPIEAANSYFGPGRDTRAYDDLSHARIAVSPVPCIGSSCSGAKRPTLAALTTPIIHASTTSASTTANTAAVTGADPKPTSPDVTGSDPEPIEPDVVQATLILLNLA